MAMTLGDRLEGRPTFELALIGFLVMLVPASMSMDYGSLGAYISSAVAVISICGILRVRASTEELRRLLPLPMIVIILGSTTIAAMTGTLSWSFVRGTPVQWGSLIGVVTLAGIWQERGGNPQRWAMWLVMASAAISLLAIYEYVLKEYIRLDDLYSWAFGIRFDDGAFRRSASSFRSISTMGNPLPLGTVAAVGAVGALGLYLRSVQVIYLLLLYVNAVASFATLSRSSWLALLLGSAIVGGTYLIRNGIGSLKMHLHFAFVTILAVGLTIVPSFQEYVVGQIEQVSETLSGRLFEQDSISYSYRMKTPSDAIGSMIESPYSLLVGFGLGAENAFYLGGKSSAMLTGNTAKDAGLLRTFDNSYITIAYSFGLLGLVAFMHIIYLRFRSALADALQQQFWRLGMLTALIVCLYFYNGISIPSVGYLTACLLAFRSNREITSIGSWRT